jgi:hypothetical protein
METLQEKIKFKPCVSYLSKNPMEILIRMLWEQPQQLWQVLVVV